jgi:hypothetical protein
LQSTLGRMLENELTIQKGVEALSPLLIQAETRIEGSQVLHQIAQDEGERGIPPSRLPLVLSCMNTGALQLAVESRKYHRVYLGELVLLDGAHPLLEIQDWDDQNMETGSLYFDELKKIQKDC